MRWSFLISCALLTACGPGVADYTDRIGNTQYDFASTDSNSGWLFPRKECGPACPAIERNVVRFDWNDQAIAVRRQVVNNYRCDEGFTTSLWLNRYEQYVIVLATNQLIGPMTVAQYRQYERRNANLLNGIELLDENSQFDGNGLRYGTLDDCTNPVAS
jgi:CubicO group peptidase (beta-lactamase class C family)